MKKVENSLQKTVKAFPNSSGIYMMKDKKGFVLYIGKAKNLKSRVQSYFVNSKSFKNQFLSPRIHHVEYILTETETEAFLLEAHLIKKHKPRYNVQLKDDKSFPYIRCSMEEDYPRFYLDRKVKKKGSVYFGPYTEAYSARRMIRFLNQHFKIRDCSNHFMKSRTTPCLTHQMGNCTAPCVDKVTKKSYQEQIKQATGFLKKQNKELLKDMKVQMEKFARLERFEEAARLRDYIHSIEFCKNRQVVVDKTHQDSDVLTCFGDKTNILFQTLHIRAGSVVGERHYYSQYLNSGSFFYDMLSPFILQYYMDNFLPDLVLVDVNPAFVNSEEKSKLKKNFFSNLEKALSKIHDKPVCVRSPKNQLEKRLMSMASNNAKNRLKEKNSKQNLQVEGLKEIQKKFHLKKIPERMECFDVSHFQGSHLVASQVVFENGVPRKEDYRKYKIKTVKGVDDFASIKEVLSRRLKHTEYKEPDLLIVDGGKGQLSQAVRVLKELHYTHIPVVAIAKARVKSDFSAKQIQTGKEKFFLPNRKNPVIFSTHSKALPLLVHIRDEAHRFAIQYYRKLSQKL